MSSPQGGPQQASFHPPPREGGDALCTLITGGLVLVPSACRLNQFPLKMFSKNLSYETRHCSENLVGKTLGENFRFSRDLALIYSLGQT